MEALLFALLIVPPILAYLLRRTFWWWTPGVALFVGGLITLLQRDTSAHGEDAALAGLGNAVLVLMGGGLWLYALVLLGITYGARRALRRPVATAVAGDMNER